MPDLSASGRDGGTLAIVLHTHMPYVEGFGTWPFGEEWLWEAIATSYVPLLELLERGSPLTLSLTPVLCDQLEAEGLLERFTRFIEDIRRRSHAEDAAGLRAAGEAGLAAELERSWGDYLHALEALRARGGDLLAALAPFAQWTSSATHAILPLLASEAGVRLQVASGLRSHRRRFGEWAGGFWLPECAHAPWLEPLLCELGVRSCCIELSGRLGVGAAEHLRPLRGPAGLQLTPVDRATMALVWSDQGYPAAGAYRDYHHHTVHHHNPWNNAGEPYEHERALALAAEHAADFVARTRRRLAHGGLVVCALDTELLGHWWYEGIAWLEAVVEECERQDLELLRLDEALERHPAAELSGLRGEPADPARWPASSWGTAGDLSTWSGPQVAPMAFATRSGELALLQRPAAGPPARRELLALQASDWAFMRSRDITAVYADERFEGHRRRLQAALAGAGDPGALRNLAVDAGGLPFS